MSGPALPLEPGRDRLLRLDSAAVLKRFFYLERALVLACAGWVPAVHRLETKELLARSAWEDALIADALRTRVFELHYPDRSLEVGPDAALVRLFESSLHAPGAAALLRAMAEVFVPWLTAAYAAYLDATDENADGPSRRFLEHALQDKARQQAAFAAAAGGEPDDDAGRWVEELRRLTRALGGPGITDPRPADVPDVLALGGPGITDPRPADVPDVLAPGRPFRLAQQPARDNRYFVCSFYWPDALDPGFGYGEGLRLQLRSAISHLNEVWAVETAGAILQGLAAELGWEFVRDAARWLYDESRHMAMGRQRLAWWGFEPASIPLGSYIYEACRDQDPVVRLGMLAFFETKNIGRKRERADELGRLGDRTSQRDMDFDWADEAIHAGYGRRWLRRALQARGDDPERWPDVVRRCEDLVAARVARATEQERDAIRERAEALIARAGSVAQVTPEEGGTASP